jgi:hypothetical protein
MMKSEDDYLQLLTSEHRDKPLFKSAVLALVEGLRLGTNMALQLPDSFALDEAVGAQLDAIGLWIGVGRFVPTPITGVYMTWESATLGWESGYWQGEFDPAVGLSSVDDVTYRTMIRAKIAANIWDGSIEKAYAVWDLVFGSGAIFIQDNFDMSMTIIYDTTKMDPVEVQLLIGGYFKMKPAGVLVTYTPLSSAPLFSWERNSITLQGWNAVSVWA